MLDMKSIRDDADALKRALGARNWQGMLVEETVANLFSLDDDRRTAIAATQKLLEERNRLSKEVGQAMARKDIAKADELKAAVVALREQTAAAEAEERAAIAALEQTLAEIPNMPLPDVPVGKDEAENVEHHRTGEAPRFPNSFAPKEHFDIGEALGAMDFATAAKISGSRFVVLKGVLARLERALMQFMLDLHTTEHGYVEVSPPLLVRDHALFGTAQLPKFEDDQFWAVSGELLGTTALIEADKLRKARLGMIPTAEVPLTNLVREEVLDEKALPLRFTAGTASFRAEAGAAGRDTRGMIRQHQFYKVELVSITTPEGSASEHERMLDCAEAVLRRLGLAYRVVTLCTGDMGFASQKTFDIEVWLPGQNRFREISSCSVCGDFQARRMNARYRPAEGKSTRFVHTLNGSGVAVGRALVAVLENYQNPDGSVSVPEVLIPYMGGLKRIEPAAA